MRNKIIAFITLIGMSFTTFAQTTSPILVVNEDGKSLTVTSEETDKVANVDKEEGAKEESQVMTMAKSTGKKTWSERSTLGKILIIAGSAVIVVLAILVPGGYNSRSGI